MLLCKQPGETGVFATAVDGDISIYHLSTPSELLRGVEAVTSTTLAKETVSHGTDTTRNEQLNTHVVATRSDLDTHVSLLNHRETSPADAPMRRGEEPLFPLCVISESELRHRGVLNFPCGGVLGVHQLCTSQLRPSPTAPGVIDSSDSGRGYSRNVPLTLSLSCARDDALRLFFSCTNMGAWIVAESPLSAHHTLYTPGTKEDHIFMGHGTEIVASAWSPLSFAELAIGRDDGVVQLLNINSSTEHMGTEACTLNLAMVDSTRTISNSDQVSFGVSPTGASALTCVPESVTFPTSSVVNVVREHRLRGAVTSMDWMPRSNTTVVAAKRPDGAGYYVELMDLRSLDSGIRHLGVPSGTISTLQQLSGTGSSISAHCCADIVACDYSQRYVATVGTQSGRDVAQLWDVRIPSRPFCCQIYPRAGYTSLCWTTHDIPTVIGTTRNGGLRVHVFSDACPSGAENGKQTPSEEEEEETEDNGLFQRPTTTTFISSSSSVFKRVTKRLEESQSLQPSMAAAGVAWLADHRYVARCLEGTKIIGEKGETLQKEDGKPNLRDTSRCVESGSRMDLPCLLLLNADNGKLYPQVFSTAGCKTAMIGEVPLCSAGPNIFSLCSMRLCWKRPEWTCAEQDVESVNNNSMDSARLFDGFDDGSGSGSGSSSSVSEGEKVGVQLSGVAQSANMTTAELIDFYGGATLKEFIGITGVERTFRRVERLRAGFWAESHRVFSVLLQEGCDHEAYTLFRYGWYVQRYLYSDKTAMSSLKVVPGLLELLEREGNVVHSGTIPLRPIGIRELILRAMGWLIDPKEEQLMVVPPGEVAVNTGNLSYNSMLSTLQVPVKEEAQQQQQQQLSDGLAALFPRPWSRTNDSEGMDAVFPTSPTPQLDLPACSFIALGPPDYIAAATKREAVERRVAILVCMGYLREASLLLSRNSNLHPLYSFLAPALLGAAAQGCLPSTLTLDVSTCSFWMKLCLAFAKKFLKPVSFSSDSDRRGFGGNESGGGLFSLSIQQRRKDFVLFSKRFPSLPLSDLIALATLFLLEPEPIIDSKDQYNTLIEVLHDIKEKQLEPNVSGGFSLLLAAAVDNVSSDCASLQRYVDETGDLQTPLVYVALYGPTRGSPWRCWNDAYRSRLNTEGNFFLRSIHDRSCIKMAQLREGNIDGVGKTINNIPQPQQQPQTSHLGRLGIFSPPNVGLMDVHFGVLACGGGGGAVTGAKTKSRRPEKGDVELRCKCGKVISPSFQITPGSKTNKGWRQQMSGCSPNCPTAMCTVCGQQMFSQSSGYGIESSFTWCTVCLHGGHWAHLRDWFAKHQTCPAEGCFCLCCPSFLPN